MLSMKYTQRRQKLFTQSTITRIYSTTIFVKQTSFPFYKVYRRENFEEYFLTARSSLTYVLNFGYLDCDSA